MWSGPIPRAPLYDDGASEAKAATRDYVFELDTPGGAPLLSIYGGKITTYRRLAEEALERRAAVFAQRKSEGGLDRQVAAARRRHGRFGGRRADGGTDREYPFLTPAHANRLAHAYGTRATKLLGNAKSLPTSASRSALP